jgi:hypothetical protein
VQIDGALLLGKPFRIIAKEFGVARSTLHKHSIKHVRGILERAVTRATAAYTRDLRSYMKRTQEAVLHILESAKADGDRELALRAAAEARANTECMRKLMVKAADPRGKEKQATLEPDVEARILATVKAEDERQTN